MNNFSVDIAQFKLEKIQWGTEGERDGSRSLLDIPFYQKSLNQENSC